MAIHWNAEKNELLKRERGISFEEDDEGMFLKTIYPNRDLHRYYGGDHE
ncbi:MAG: hypothetical protein WCQ50_15065 [Spirochaetota bacterium]